MINLIYINLKLMHIWKKFKRNDILINDEYSCINYSEYIKEMMIIKRYIRKNNNNNNFYYNYCNLIKRINLFKQNIINECKINKRINYLKKRKKLMKINWKLKHNKIYLRCSLHGLSIEDEKFFDIHECGKEDDRKLTMNIYDNNFNHPIKYSFITENGLFLLSTKYSNNIQETFIQFFQHFNYENFNKITLNKLINFFIITKNSIYAIDSINKNVIFARKPFNSFIEFKYYLNSSKECLLIKVFENDEYEYLFIIDNYNSLCFYINQHLQWKKKNHQYSCKISNVLSNGNVIIENSGSLLILGRVNGTPIQRLNLNEYDILHEIYPSEINNGLIIHVKSIDNYDNDYLYVYDNNMNCTRVYKLKYSIRILGISETGLILLSNDKEKVLCTSIY